MDKDLKAAIGYMLPEDMKISDVIIDLQERVSSEADQVTGCFIVDWNGHVRLKKGFGELTAKVRRVGLWEDWVISRREGKQEWPILHWEETRLDSD